MNIRERCPNWIYGSAIFGAMIWALLFPLSRPFLIPIGIIEQLFVLALLVIVPLALSFYPKGGTFKFSKDLFDLALLLQPVAAVIGISSFLFRPGVTAAFLSLPWFFLCVSLASAKCVDFFRSKDARGIEEISFVIALLYLVIGGSWFLISRFGANPMGIQEPIAFLTAVHFHYTGFATMVLVAVTGFAIKSRFHSARIAFRAIAIGIIAGTPLIAAGFVFSPLLKVISVSLLVVSLFAFSLLTFMLLPSVAGRARIFLGVSASSVIIGMVLAAIYSIAEYQGKLPISIPEMARTHGFLNALGFVLCGLIGFRICPREIGRKS